MMADELKPVAWMYEGIKPFGERVYMDPPFIQFNRANMDPRYWTETPVMADWLCALSDDPVASRALRIAAGQVRDGQWREP